MPGRRVWASLLSGVLLLAVLTACSVTPPRAVRPVRPVAAVAHPAPVAGPPPVPAEAQAEFEHALALAHAGNDDAAEAQLTTLARQYPQFSTPLVDLGIVYRNSGNLDAAAHALQQAVARDPH
ncbi:MAG TPA: tetratricopeptide repeat protein, partial [Steroidobacteraceae bacterium]|nr:tetratricopeptide repeat protein [Steroidobacteraceae bacterium]